VKDYRRHTSPAQGWDCKTRDGLRCLEEDVECEMTGHQARKDRVRQNSDEEAQFVVPRSRGSAVRGRGGLSDETNLHQSRLPCKRNLLAPASSLRSRLPHQVGHSSCCS